MVGAEVVVDMQAASALRPAAADCSLRAVRTIGLLGGMSWESSIEYYRLVNELTRERLGGAHSARCVMWSLDFDEVQALQAAGDWEGRGGRCWPRTPRRSRRPAPSCSSSARTRCTASAPAIADAISIPLLHIGDATADAIASAGLERVGLLGTRYTMEAGFLAERHRRARDRGAGTAARATATSFTG